MKTERRNNLALNKVKVANVNNVKTKNAKDSAITCLYTAICDTAIMCLVTELAECKG